MKRNPTLMRVGSLMKSYPLDSAMMSALMTITPHDGIPTAARPPRPAALAVRR